MASRRGLFQGVAAGLIIASMGPDPLNHPPALSLWKEGTLPPSL
jgi:hypothetical protein